MAEHCLFGVGWNSRGTLGCGKKDKLTLTRLDWFCDKQLQISKVTLVYESLFVVTTNGCLYVTGFNEYGQLGIGSKGHSLFTPQLNEFYTGKRVLHIGRSPESEHTFVTVAKSIDRRMNIICEYWVRIHCKADRFIPQSLIDIISKFSDETEVYGQGNNQNNQLCGEKTDKSGQVSTPVRIEMPTEMRNIIKCSCNEYHSCFLDDKGQLCGIGSNDYGKLGLEKSETSFENAALIPLFSKYPIIDVNCGYNHSVFLDSNGMVWTVGINDRGQIGIGSDDKSISKVSVIPFFKDHDVKISQVSCGTYHSAAVSTKGDLYTWGCNRHRQLGCDGEKRNAPIKVELNGDTVVKVECGYFHTVAMTNECQIYAFGQNKWNECLDYTGPNESQSFPVRVCLDKFPVLKGYSVRDFAVGYHTTVLVAVKN